MSGECLKLNDFTCAPTGYFLYPPSSDQSDNNDNHLMNSLVFVCVSSCISWLRWSSSYDQRRRAACLYGQVFATNNRHLLLCVGASQLTTAVAVVVVVVVAHLASLGLSVCVCVCLIAATFKA